MKTKFAVIADMHLPYLSDTAQYAAFEWAIEDINKNCPQFVIIAGDISACGDMSALEYFKGKLNEISVPCKVILGNADVRTKENTDAALMLRSGFTFCESGREFMCLNTPFGYIDENDKKALDDSGDKAIVFMHHSVQGLCDDSREFLKNWAESRKGIIIHAHSHKSQDYYIGGTRVIGVRCTDPEKSVGAPPCITYFTLSEEKSEYEEKCFEFPKNNLADFRSKMGISCFDIYGDIDFATENNIVNIEIRKFDGSDAELDFLIKKTGEWRANGGKIISVHMPNLKFEGGEFTGIELWQAAVRIAKATGAETVTVHPPRNLSLKEFDEKSEIYRYAVDYFFERLSELPPETSIGIENIHFDKYDADEKQRFFGYTPDEILDFVSELNKKFGFERVGVVFDIGHARNNGPCYTRNTIGVWCKKVGNKTTAYHIHQVAQGENGKKNHTAITDWEGERNICFTAFLWGWQAGQLNHRPMFMEMKTRENCKKTLDSLQNYINNNLK